MDTTTGMDEHMSVYTQLEQDNKADRACLCTVQGIALALKAEGTISAWGQEQLQKIIAECELRLKGDRRLSSTALIISVSDVKEWK